MSSDRWQEINRIYDAALEIALAERPAFLQEACRGDEELRREVESMLAENQEARVDERVLNFAAQTLASEPPSLVGRKLGPYQILGVLGAGGMGEVYRARDTRLNRTIAIKVLPRHLSERADLRQRFEREARAIASLDHPHICALYDIGHEGETDFLVMQFLEGETLSQRLKRGPLPTAEVLRYSVEIAGALDTAHRQGVIHRDLKPGNIMLTEAGAKLLDFGLAKQRTLSPLARGTTGDQGYGNDEPSPSGGRLPHSESLTEEGMILGTLEYMAPEQLEGKEADARTDVFALGVVIYEMATGRKAFEGDSKASLIAKILTFEPPAIETIQPVSPAEMNTVVQKCLAKKPEDRWQTAAELGSALEQAAEAETLRRPKTLAQLIRPRAWMLVFAGLVAVVLAFLILRHDWQQSGNRAEGRKELSFKPLTFYSDSPVGSAAISPNGNYLALCLNGKLSIQVTGTGDKRALDLPEGFYAESVVWFPDGTKLLLSQPEERWVEVKGQNVRGIQKSLWSLSILGGTPKRVVDLALLPAVSPDGSLIAFSRFNYEQNTVNNWVVGANGEQPRPIRQVSRTDESYFAPVWSTDGKRIFFIRDDGHAHWIESCGLNGEHVTRIYPAESGVRYDVTEEGIGGLALGSDGRILFSRKETAGKASLWEIKVDAKAGRPLSPARQITELVNFSGVNALDLSVTADGKKLVVLRSTHQADVYIAELERGGKAMKNPKRLTFVESEDVLWSWTADGRAVLFQSMRNGNWDIFKQDINQAEAEPIVATSSQDETYPSLSPDGAFILYLVSPKLGPYGTRLMRVPVSGGPPDLVLSGEKIKNFSCARAANLCVVEEEVEGKQILTTFDPLKGRGEKLPSLDNPGFAHGLSPRSDLIEKMKAGPAGLYIRVRSLGGGPAKEITFKNLIGDYRFKGWSVDGKGIYLQEWTATGFQVLYAGLNGDTAVLWKRGANPGWWIDYPVGSPDGRHLAFTLGTRECNAWVLENF